MEPRHYLSASYYERSLTSLATLCVEKGILTREELERRAEGSFPLSAASAPVARTSREDRPSSPAIACACAATTSPPRSHAGLHPRQERRGGGRIAGVPFPTPSHGVKAADEPTYDVRFNAEELWPNSADPAFVHVGVFQSYLERWTESLV